MREKRRTHRSFGDPERNVGLAVVHCEAFGAGIFHREGVPAAAGGGALEGSWEGGVPRPRPDEVVSFLTFHERGLGYPAHWFLHGLLNEWRLELQHLNPTGVLHIVGFVTVCEAFLRMEPHVDLFR